MKVRNNVRFGWLTRIYLLMILSPRQIGRRRSNDVMETIFSPIRLALPTLLCRRLACATHSLRLLSLALARLRLHAHDGR